MRKQKKTKNEFDVIIIGGGAAGISTALWCEELGLQTLILEQNRELGGQLLIVHNPIKNHLGAETDNGREMREIFLAQIKKRRVKILKNIKIDKIDFAEKEISLNDGKTFSARALVIATGVSRRKLNVEGEEKFAGKGIIESGKRDAKKYADKAVCIVGGGDAALENVSILSEHAAKIYLVHRRKNFRARPEFIKQVSENPKVEILTESVIKKICGNRRIESVKVENIKTKKTQTIDIQGLLVRIGVSPNTAIGGGKLNLDKNGYIKTDRDCRTNLKDIYAVGDVANPISPTVSTAVGTGATAAKKILSETKKRKIT